MTTFPFEKFLKSRSRTDLVTCSHFRAGKNPLVQPKENTVLFESSPSMICSCTKKNVFKWLSGVVFFQHQRQYKFKISYFNEPPRMDLRCL